MNEENQQTFGATPYWNELGAITLPFFSPKEEEKKAGFIIDRFLCDEPRKQTVNYFDPDKPRPELWFDVEIEGEERTWTITQKSLLNQLKRHAPLKDKGFKVKLIPVDEEFRKQFPKFKGRERYLLEELRRKLKPGNSGKVEGPMEVEKETVEYTPEQVRERFLELLRAEKSNQGIEISKLVKKARLEEKDAEQMIDDLLKEGEVFKPKPGFLKAI